MENDEIDTKKMEIARLCLEEASNSADVVRIINTVVLRLSAGSVCDALCSLRLAGSRSHNIGLRLKFLADDFEVRYHLAESGDAPTESTKEEGR